MKHVFMCWSEDFTDLLWSEHTPVDDIYLFSPFLYTTKPVHAGKRAVVHAKRVTCCEHVVDIVSYYMSTKS